MKFSNILKFFCTFSIALIVGVVFGQDEEDIINIPDNGMVVVDETIPQPAPLVVDEVFPLPDKDSVRIRLKKLSKNTQIPLTYNQTVYSFIHYFTVRNREYSKMVLRRRDLYFPIFEKVLKEMDLPDELKYLSIVESGLNPRARSRAGAVGLWQFVPSTGKYYGLDSDWYSDDRQDPYQSTVAACKYLKYLYERFGQWELALAAYNCGPTATARAVKNCRNKKDFWEVYYHLPRETRSYVPQFIAVTYMFNYSDYYKLTPDYFEALEEHLTIHTDQYVNLEILAQKLGICVEDIHKLNPTLTKSVVPGYYKNFKLKLPARCYPTLAENYCSIMDTCSIKGSEDLINEVNPFSEKATTRANSTHVVKKGEVLQAIAKKYGVTTKELMAWNNLSSTQLKYGQKLTIWKAGYQKNEDKKELARSTIKLPNNQKVYYVQPGDTLWSISQKTAVPLTELKKINNLKSNQVKPGQKLIIG